MGVYTKTEYHLGTCHMLVLPFTLPMNAQSYWEDWGPQWGDEPMKMFMPKVYENKPNKYNLVLWEKAPREFQEAFKAQLHDIFSNQDPLYERGIVMVVIEMLFL